MGKRATYLEESTKLTLEEEAGQDDHHDHDGYAGDDDDGYDAKLA